MRHPTRKRVATRTGGGRLDQAQQHRRRRLWAKLEADDLAIDALLGIGAARAPAGAIGETIAQLNAFALPVLAADTPSGLNATTGRPLGAACVVAQHTLTLLTLKPGLFTALGARPRRPRLVRRAGRRCHSPSNAIGAP